MKVLHSHLREELGVSERVCVFSTGPKPEAKSQQPNVLCHFSYYVHSCGPGLFESEKYKQTKTHLSLIFYMLAFMCANVTILALLSQSIKIMIILESALDLKIFFSI